MSAEVIRRGRAGRRRRHRACASCRCRPASSQRATADGWVAVDELRGRRHPVDPVPRGGVPRGPAARALDRRPAGRSRRSTSTAPAGEDVEDLLRGRPARRPAGPHSLGAARHRHRAGPARAVIRACSSSASTWSTAPAGRRANATGWTARDVAARYSFVGTHLLLTAQGHQVRVAARRPGLGGGRRRVMHPVAVLAGAGRRRRRRRRACWCRRSSSATTRDRAGERGRPVRRHRDRRDPHAAGHDDDRAGEGRGARHRPAGGRDPGPLRRDERRRAWAGCTAPAGRPPTCRPRRTWTTYRSTATTCRGGTQGRTPAPSREATPYSSAECRSPRAAGCCCDRRGGPTPRTCSSPG